jgi:ribosomal protein S18 acetylase RimI-like enzyme
MNDEILIRLAQPAEASALVEFNQAMALETEGKTLVDEKIGNGVKAVFSDEKKGFYVVAEDNGKIAGGLMITFEWSDWRDAWFWWIQSVYILPEYRGKRIYRMLYEFVKNEAGKQGNVCGFRLYVEHDNLRAQKVYEKLGMQSSHYLMYEEQV